MEDLSQLYNELIEEQSYLQKRLDEIQDELHSISKVLKLIDKRKAERNDKQISFIQGEKSDEYAEMNFREAALDFLAKHAEDKFAPKDIAEGLLKRGFKTNSKDFNSVVRTMFAKFRDKGIVDAEKTQKGKMETWHYQHKKEEEQQHQKNEVEFKEDEDTQAPRIRRRIELLTG